MSRLDSFTSSSVGCSFEGSTRSAPVAAIPYEQRGVDTVIMDDEWAKKRDVMVPVIGERRRYTAEPDLSDNCRYAQIDYAQTCIQIHYITLTLPFQLDIERYTRVRAPIKDAS